LKKFYKYKIINNLTLFKNMIKYSYLLNDFQLLIINIVRDEIKNLKSR